MTSLTQSRLSHSACAYAGHIWPLARGVARVCLILQTCFVSFASIISGGQEDSSLRWHDSSIGGWYDDGADSSSYWDHTYSLHGTHGRASYEWYGLGYHELKDAFAKHLPVPAGELLVAGAGDSQLSSDLAHAGHSITSIDFSEEIVGRMQAAYPKLRFMTMDARNMSFAAGTFWAVIDKGLSDCFGSAEQLRKYYQEVHRVLRKPGGVLFVISMKLIGLEGELDLDWDCEPRTPLLGPLFVDTSEFSPAVPQPGTEGTIPYYLTVCRSLLSTTESESHRDL